VASNADRVAWGPSEAAEHTVTTSLSEDGLNADAAIVEEPKKAVAATTARYGDIRDFKLRDLSPADVV